MLANTRVPPKTDKRKCVLTKENGNNSCIGTAYVVAGEMRGREKGQCRTQVNGTIGLKGARTVKVPIQPGRRQDGGEF